MNVRLATLDDVETISSMYRDFFAFNAELQPDYYKKAESGEYPVNTIKSETADIIVVQTDDSISWKWYWKRIGSIDNRKIQRILAHCVDCLQ